MYHFFSGAQKLLFTRLLLHSFQGCNKYFFVNVYESLFLIMCGIEVLLMILKFYYHHFDIHDENKNKRRSWYYTFSFFISASSQFPPFPVSFNVVLRVCALPVLSHHFCLKKRKSFTRWDFKKGSRLSGQGQLIKDTAMHYKSRITFPTKCYNMRNATSRLKKNENPGA